MRMLPGVIESQQFDLETLEAVFEESNTMAKLMLAEHEAKARIKSACNEEELMSILADVRKSNRYRSLLDTMELGSLFYEPSTRTNWSFTVAMKKLGGKVTTTDSAKIFSSAAKGESLEDAIRVLSGYPIDALVLRYDKQGGALRAQKFSSVPIINAGDGKGQHPTQALLDLYTIKQHFGELRGLTIVMMGDLENGRTVRSLAYFFGKHFPDNEIIFISPEKVRMRADIKDYLTKSNVRWSEMFSPSEGIIRHADVIYQTRIQAERFEDNLALLQEIKSQSPAFMIDDDFLEQMDSRGIILHPLPRVDEIAYSVDNDPRSLYFQQAWNGVYVRMALLKMILVGY